MLTTQGAATRDGQPRWFAVVGAGDSWQRGSRSYGAWHTHAAGAVASLHRARRWGLVHVIGGPRKSSGQRLPERKLRRSGRKRAEEQQRGPDLHVARQGGR
ncbi:vegetative cell wall protein gp1-like [Iris pallida]|uniref:Vegetative cell wall protein gp1-like n=1 Tax=Iris pallida TaxID=29817 RepID=A0AAX6DQB4_IRIPA|nr:vegetative cell wall protein gp1-like [Iris pallida]